MEIVYRILKYLKMIVGQNLLYKKKGNREVEVFPEADWAGKFLIESILQDIAIMFGGILWLEEAKSDQLWLEVVPKQKLDPLLLRFLKVCG